MKLFNYLKNLFIGIMVKLSLSLYKTEKELFKVKKDVLDGSIKEIDNIQSDLLKSLKKGEFNKEYVDKFYKILKMSDKISYSSKNELKEKFAKHGLEYGNQELNTFINSDINYTDININKKYDISDGYVIELMIKNVKECTNILEVLNNNVDPIYTTTIKTLGGTKPIEYLMDYLHVKTINEKEKLIDIYINNELLIDKNIDNYTDLNYLKFKDKYGDLYEYKILYLVEIKDNEFNKILKFKANVI